MADLESANLVEETGNTEGGIGRRAQTYRLSPQAGYAVGIDLGGTNFRSGLFLCGDNLRKGAALNTAQIAELLAVEFTA